jgi:hypothetical protein
MSAGVFGSSSKVNTDLNPSLMLHTSSSRSSIDYGLYQLCPQGGLIGGVVVWPRSGSGRKASQQILFPFQL